MKIFKIKTLLFLSLFFVSYTTYSQDVVDTLGQVVVTATRSYVNKSQTPMNITVINREQIDAGSESSLLPVLTETVPGLFVTERGVTGFGVSAGSAGAISIRGIGGGNKVLMLFDGQPQWAGIFGHHIPDTYVASDMDRVEVVRGPASLLYGSNATAGVVNMITRNPRDGMHFNGRLMHGSHNTQKYMGNVSFKKDKFSGIVSLNHDRTDGHRDNSNFKIFNGYAKLGYEINPNWKVSGDIILADFTTMNPGEENNPIFDNIIEALRGTASISIDNHYEMSHGSVKAFYNFGNHEINDGWREGENPRNYLFNSHDYNRGIMAYQIFNPYKETQVTLGMDYKEWGGKAWNSYFSGVRTDIINTNVYEYASYVVAQQKLWNKLTINAGLRLEVNETYWLELIPQIGAAFNASPSTTVKALVSKGFRSPNLRELYLYVPANPKLDPERMMNYDFTIAQQFFNNKLGIELTGYFIEGSNIIQTRPVNGKPLNVNTGSFIHKGIEFAADYRIIPQFNLSAIYSYLHMNEPLVAAPKHQAYITAKGKWGNFSYMLGAQYINDLYLVTGDSPITVSYFLLNAKLSYRPIKFLSVFVKGENLTDKKYAINYGFPMPGLIIYGGIDINL